MDSQLILQTVCQGLALCADEETEAGAGVLAQVPTW